MLRWIWLIFVGVGLLGAGCRNMDGKDKTMLELFEKAPRPKAPGSRQIQVVLPGTGAKHTIYVSGLNIRQDHMSLLLHDVRLVPDVEGGYLMQLFLNDRGQITLAGLPGNTRLLLVASWYDANAKPKAGMVRRLLGSFEVDERMKQGIMQFTPSTKTPAEAEERVKGIKRMLGHKVK